MRLLFLVLSLALAWPAQAALVDIIDVIDVGSVQFSANQTVTAGSVTLSQPYSETFVVPGTTEGALFGFTLALGDESAGTLASFEFDEDGFTIFNSATAAGGGDAFSDLFVSLNLTFAEDIEISFDFADIGDATSIIELFQEGSLVDLSGPSLTFLAGSSITLNFDSLAFANGQTELTATVVPVPAAIWFFVSALVGLAVVRRNPKA